MLHYISCKKIEQLLWPVTLVRRQNTISILFWLLQWFYIFFCGFEFCFVSFGNCRTMTIMQISDNFIRKDLLKVLIWSRFWKWWSENGWTKLSDFIEVSFSCFLDGVTLSWFRLLYNSSPWKSSISCRFFSELKREIRRLPHHAGLGSHLCHPWTKFL